MSAIVLRGFSGMAPSSNLKSVDPAIAAYAKNLNLRFADFRPMPIPTNVATVTAGGTLYKFETTGGFITRVGTVNFVTGPIPTDTTERTYYTGDGIPKVTDATGAVRQLGVPQPELSPNAVVVAVADFTPELALAAKGYKQAVFSNIIWDNCDVTYVGLSDAELATYFAPAAQAWMYKFPVAGTLTSGVFNPTNPAHRNLMSDTLGFYLTDVAGTVTGYVDVAVRGTKRSFNSTMAAELAAITGAQETGLLLTASQVTLVGEALTDALKPADEARDAAIGRLIVLKNEFVALANATSPSAAGGTGGMAAFYAGADIVTAVDDAVDQAVSAIFSAMLTYNN